MKNPHNSTVENTYQKKSLIEHVLIRPDTYVGSIDPKTEKMWVYSQKTNKITYEQITYVPGLYKIFGKWCIFVDKCCVDEILVNAADNYHRDKKMTQIRVKINEKLG